jgi:hypothetical protein
MRTITISSRTKLGLGWSPDYRPHVFATIRKLVGLLDRLAKEFGTTYFLWSFYVKANRKWVRLGWEQSENVRLYWWLHDFYYPRSVMWKHDVQLPAKS